MVKKYRTNKEYRRKCLEYKSKLRKTEEYKEKQRVYYHMHKELWKKYYRKNKKEMNKKCVERAKKRIKNFTEQEKIAYNKKQVFRFKKWKNNLSKDERKKFNKRNYERSKTTVSYKLHTKKRDAKKRRKGFIPILVNFFPKEIVVEYHHIHPNMPFVVPLPKTIHQTKTGNLNVHVEHNRRWIQILYCYDFNEFINDNTNITITSLK